MPKPCIIKWLIGKNLMSAQMKLKLNCTVILSELFVDEILILCPYDSNTLTMGPGGETHPSEFCLFL